MKNKKWKKPIIKDDRRGEVYSPFPIILVKGTDLYKKAKTFADYKCNGPMPSDYSVMTYPVFD